MSDTTNVSAVRLRVGTDSSNYNQYEEATLVNGWNEITFDSDNESSAVGTGLNWYEVKYIAVEVVFAATGNTLSGILIDGIQFFKPEATGGGGGG